MEKAQTMFFKAMEEAESVLGRLQPCWEAIKITMCANVGAENRSETAAKFVVESKGDANHGFSGRPSSNLYRF